MGSEVKRISHEAPGKGKSLCKGPEEETASQVQRTQECCKWWRWNGASTWDQSLPVRWESMLWVDKWGATGSAAAVAFLSGADGSRAWK